MNGGRHHFTLRHFLCLETQGIIPRLFILHNKNQFHCVRQATYLCLAHGIFFESVCFVKDEPPKILGYKKSN